MNTLYDAQYVSTRRPKLRVAVDTRNRNDAVVDTSMIERVWLDGC